MKIHPGMRLKAQLLEELGRPFEESASDYSTLSQDVMFIGFESLSAIHKIARGYGFKLSLHDGDGLIEIRLRLP